MGIKVLIVDDYKDTRDSLRLTLLNKDSSYVIEEARDANGAYAKIRSFRPDVILMDIMLPDEDGIKVIDNLRETASLEGIKVIFITAKGDAPTRVSAQLSGDDFIEKPFSVDDVHRKIKALISKN